MTRLRDSALSFIGLPLASLPPHVSAACPYCCRYEARCISDLSWHLQSRESKSEREAVEIAVEMFEQGRTT